LGDSVISEEDIAGGYLVKINNGKLRLSTSDSMNTIDFGITGDSGFISGFSGLLRVTTPTQLKVNAGFALQYRQVLRRWRLIYKGS
jgi:hypothetical protein